jgi:hypothetical protein
MGGGVVVGAAESILEKEQAFTPQVRIVIKTSHERMHFLFI